MNIERGGDARASVFNADIQRLQPGSQVRLFEVDCTPMGGEILRFHGHAIALHPDRLQADENVLFAGSLHWKAGDASKLAGSGRSTLSGLKHAVPIIWQGQTYRGISIDAQGFDLRGEGRQAAPTLSIGNNIDGVQGAVSALCLALRDLAGAKVTYRETFAHYLDAENFEGGNPEAAHQERISTWYIEQKVDEDEQRVQFELSAPTDLQGIRLPLQQITSRCRWAHMGQYRGEACNYLGTALFTKRNEPTDNPALDRCRGDWRACKQRRNNARFGGALASSLLHSSR